MTPSPGIAVATASARCDLLVGYETGRHIGLFDMVRMGWELAELLGRTVDLRTPKDLSIHFRARVVAEARRIYEA